MSPIAENRSGVARAHVRCAHHGKVFREIRSDDFENAYPAGFFRSLLGANTATEPTYAFPVRYVLASLVVLVHRRPTGVDVSHKQI